MTVALLNTGQFFAFHPTTGKPLVAGKVFTYEPGTTTPKICWKDAAKAVPHTNPIILGSMGHATIYLEDTYDLLIKDAADTTTQTLEDVSGAIISSDVQGLVDAAITASSISYGVLEVSVDTALDASAMSKLIVVDAAAADVTITLPSVVSVVDKPPVSILRLDASANSVIIDGNGVDTISGAATINLDTQWFSLSLRSDGLQWFLENFEGLVDNSINLEKLQQIDEDFFLGRVSAGTGNVESISKANMAANLLLHGDSTWEDGLVTDPSTVSPFAVRASADAAIAAISLTDSPAWHPYDMVNIGDGADGVIYDFAVDGAVAAIETPNFVDGYEYMLEFKGLSAVTTPTVRIQGFKETDAAYQDYATSGTLSGGSLYDGFVKFRLPRMSGVIHTAQASMMEAPIVAADQFPDSIYYLDDTTIQKISKARLLLSFSTFDAGKVFLYRRREFITG